jgi:hypothetical protein
MNRLAIRARQACLPVRASIESDVDIATSPALTPIHRNGSGSHFGDVWLTHGNCVRGVERLKTKSASVRPPRFDAPTPSPT